jgi:hypothetical protein
MMPYDPSQGLSPEEMSLLLRKMQQPLEMTGGMGMDDPGRSFSLEQPPMDPGVGQGVGEGGILDELEANPYGYGSEGLASPEEGINPPQDPPSYSPMEAYGRLLAHRAPEELDAAVDVAPETAAFMAAGPVLGGIGKVMSAYPKVAPLLAGAGAFLTSSSEAGSPNLTKRQRREMEMERQRIELEAASKERLLEAETRAQGQREKESAATKAKADKEAAALVEYNRQVEVAEKARDFELGRDRRFSDTTLGKTFDALGGSAPFLAGVAGGKLSRWATGPGKVVKDYLLPGVMGTATGFTAANIPLAYNALYTEPDNPKKAGYGAYARELPQGHPRKAEFGAYAESLPDKNPVREQASEEMFDPWRLAERGAISVVEGGGGGLVGSDAVRSAARGAGSKVVDTVKGLFKSKPAPANVTPKVIKRKAAQFIPGVPGNAHSGMSPQALTDALTKDAAAWFKANPSRALTSTQVTELANAKGIDVGAKQARTVAKRLRTAYEERYINAGAKAALKPKP